MTIRRWLWLAALGFVGCDYGTPSEVVLGVPVYTQAAPGSDFTPLRTYYLDPAVEVWNNSVQQPSVTIPTSVATTIAAQMTALGYTAASQPAAETGLRLAWEKTTQVIYSGGYCSIYWGYYGCWPTWGYAGSYTTGTTLMTMVDLRTTPPSGGTRPTLWVTALYGVLQSSTVETNAPALNQGLVRAFNQSPYLRTSAAP
jgi:hypothetical protein